MISSSETQAWRLAREADLRKDYGWLSLAGLFFLEQGDNVVGPEGPVIVDRAHGPLGSFVLDDGKVRFKTPQGLSWSLDGDRNGGDPSVLFYEDFSLTLVWRNDQWAIRLKDNRAPTRTGFRGLAWIPYDSQWSLTGSWEPSVPPRRVPIRNVLGHESAEEFHGRAVLEGPAGGFSLWGQAHEDNEIFFNFRDATSGRTTYGAGRFLEGRLIQGGKIEVDFNRAYNPPCAFTAYATCPLPPSENRLAFPVNAGELVPPR